tara:strand:+ start:123 stop:242 length:120 start_codon:yes stop_codon:yes gene_type:complete
MFILNNKWNNSNELENQIDKKKNKKKKLPKNNKNIDNFP